MATQISQVAPTTTAVPRAPAQTDPKADAARILAETRIGDTNTHRVNFIEAALDKIADPAKQAAVRAEVMKGLSSVEQGQLKALEPSLVRDAGNGQTVKFSTDSKLTQDQWIDAARKGNYTDLKIFERLAGANDNASIKRAMDDVQSGRITPSQFAEAKAAVDEKSWTDKAGDVLAMFSPAGLAMEAAQPAIASLARDAGLGKTEWGAHLQKILDTPGSMRAFNAGVATGMVEGAKSFVVDIAKLAGKVVQFGADNSIAGTVGDFARSVVPDSVKGWLRDVGIGGAINEVVPSAQRGEASVDALTKMGSNAATYFATHTPAQVANDVKNGISKIWDSVKADHAKAAAQGPEAEARWWGKLVGRVTFEVASTFVPVAGQVGKGGKLAKGADLATDALRVTDRGADALRAEEATRKTIAAGEVVVDGSRVARAASVVERTIGQNTVKWVTDAEGRLTSASATLKEVFPGLKRSAAEVEAQGAAAAKGIAGDHGGHAIPHRFVKDQGGINMFPQNGVPNGALKNFNGSAFKTLENELADWVQAGGTVKYDVSFSNFTGARPGTVEVRYKVFDSSGKEVFKNFDSFENAAGQTFDRVSKADIVRMLDPAGK